jgi:DNA-binding transcriptional regulator YdaS (Cro superfamily)
MESKITPEVRKAIADQLGINEQYLYQCLTGRAEMHPREAARAETETKKKVTRQMLCQKTWRDTWPELTKRRKPAPATVGA